MGGMPYVTHAEADRLTNKHPPIRQGSKLSLAARASSDRSIPAERNPAAVALGRLGGLKGGKARAATLTPEQRREIARAAANARWGANKDE